MQQRLIQNDPFFCSHLCSQAVVDCSHLQCLSFSVLLSILIFPLLLTAWLHAATANTMVPQCVSHSLCPSVGQYTLLSCFLAIFLSLCSPFNLSSFLHDHRMYSPISVIFGFLLHPICFNNERYLLRLICEVSVNARKTLFFVCQKEPCFRRLLSNSCDGK